MPDFTVNGEAAKSSMQVTQEEFSASDCVVLEGCIESPGPRKLLRFDGVIRNQGSADFVLGDPALNPRFQYSACHQHYHFGNVMAYELLDVRNMRVVAVGRKQGFCMMDNKSAQGDPDSVAKYDCLYQGISAGWEDLYEASLDCQWLDITHLPPGNYLLRITVNPDHSLLESNYANNTALVPVTLSGS